MGRAPCCDKAKVKKGPWSPEEDTTLKNYLERYGTGGNWIALPQKAGLKRCGKSCRLRWLNYLRPDIKHGGFTEEEDNIILTLYSNIGSRWSVIASQLPRRTDNDVKNYWNTKLKKKLLAGTTSLTTTNNNNCNISANNSIHLISPTPSASAVTTVDNFFYGNSSACSGMNLSTFPYQVDINHHHHQQNLVSQPRIFDPIQIPLPRLTEVQENGTSAYSSLSITSSQEVSSLSPSFSCENSYVSWSCNVGGDDDGFLKELASMSHYDFPDLANATYSSLLANISETEPSQGFYNQGVAN